MAIPIITIDGPSGSGKTTVGRTVAEALGLTLIDTGLIYRSVAYEVLDASLDPRDETAVCRLANRLSATLVGGARPHLQINGRDLLPNANSSTAHLFTDEVERAVPQVARHPEVRATLLPIQQSLLAGGALLLGRDAGTAVAPQADLKVYLEASPEVRAQRLLNGERESGRGAPIAQLRKDIERRDEIDRNRETSPLRIPPGALVLDAGRLSAQGVAQAILNAFGGLQPDPQWPGGSDLLMTAVTSFFDVYLRLYCDPIRVEGLENVPSHGPVIIAPRHVHNADVNFLAHYSPRKLQFLAKTSLYQMPLIGWAIWALRAIPVTREGVDIAGLRQAMSALASGQALCVFPEGTRSRTGRLLPPHPGVGLLALRSGAPIVPVAAAGLENLDLSQLSLPPPTPVTLRFGKPFRLTRPVGRSTAQASRWASWQIMREIAHLLPDSASADIANRLTIE